MEAIYAGPRRGLHADDIAGVSALYPGGPPPPAANLVSIAVTPGSSSVAAGETQQFTATGTYDDTSTANITGSVDWASDNTAAATIDGSGVASGVAEGSAGISASQGAIGSNSATLTVTAAPPPPPAGTEVGATGVDHTFNGGKGGDKDLRVEVNVANDLGAAVEGAVVDITLHNTTSGASWTGSAATGADGSVAFRLRNAPAGCYSTDVDGISAAGLNWDGNTGPFPGATCKSGNSGNRANSGALQAD
ncbi:MAG: Ig-like domain-containing protein [Chloroflexi bacterium]|nr:Ig-like domain-containing protein [Chloroflexota bacterium]